MQIFIKIFPTNKMNLKKKILLCAFLFVLIISQKIIGAQSAESGEYAIFAGGCFWCMEADFEKVDGVKDVISGYIGGNSKNPTYNNYAKFGHIEAVQIFFDPNIISYSDLLEIFWLNIDPFDKNGQFCDRGFEYSSAIFYINAKQKETSIISKNNIKKSIFY